MEILRKRFPTLLEDLHIKLLEISLEWDKTESYLEKMHEYNMNIGDILILETITHHAIDLVLTTDKDWSRTNSKTIVL